MLASLLLALLAPALPTAAQTHKLNGPLARDASGALFATGTPDGRFLYYTRQPEGSAGENLAVELDGKHAPFAAPAPVDFTRDGQRVVTFADPEGDGQRALYLGAVDGSGTLTPLSAPFVPLGAPTYFTASPDRVHFVYQADAVTHQTMELFRAPVDGSALAQPLSGPLVPGGDVLGFLLSGDGRQVAYQADQDLDERFDVYLVPVDGSAPARRVDLPLVPGGSVQFYALDFDGSHLVYLADQEEDERFELFTVPTDASAPPTKLNAALVTGGDVGESFQGHYFPTFLLSFDGRWVTYTADQETDGRFELYSAPSDGSRPAVKLSTAADADVSLWTHSYDSAWVVYGSDPSGTDAQELFSVPIDGSAPARALSGPMVPGGDAFFPQVSFDSRYVLWEADQLVDGVQELFGAPIDGSAPAQRLSAPFVPGGDLNVSLLNLLPGFWVMQDGAMYEADQEFDGRNELYFAPFPLGSPVRKLAAGPLSDPWPLAPYLELPPKDFGKIVFLRDGEMLAVGVVPGAKPVTLDALPEDRFVGHVSSFRLTPDGARALYTAREETDVANDLYSVSTGERRQAFQLHPEGTEASVPVLSPDGTRALFTQSESAAPGGLYVAAVDGSTPPLLLSTRSTSGHSFSPDGARAFFLAEEAGDTHLFSVPSDGSAAPVRLSAGLPAGSSVGTEARSSADGRSVAFLSNTNQLHVAPSDGTLANVPVSGTGQRVLTDFALTPDGSFAVYRVSAGTRIHLFAAPRDGSAPPLRLSENPHANVQVSSFVLSPDGTRVYFQADQDVDGQAELYAVPLDASQAPLALSDPLVPGEVVNSFALSPDGSRLVFLASIPASGIPRLFSVPSDGSATRIRLGDDVLDFRITPDSRRVVFRSGGVLLSTRLVGARAPLVIGRAPFAGGTVQDYRISADSSTVAFRATRNANRRNTLLAGPVDGGQKAIELAGPFTGNGTVIDFALSADGRVAAWRSDQEVVNVLQLYAAPTGSGKNLRRP